jgi:hypothetical protein
MKRLLIIAGLLASGCSSIPSKTECEITSQTVSPIGSAAFTVGIVTGALEPISTIAVLATAGHRNSKCPRPKFITEEEFESRLAAELAKNGVNND